MKKSLPASLLLLLLCSVFAVRAAYVPVPVTGFTADVMVNGTGTPLATTTNDVDGVQWCFVVEGWQFSSSSTPVTLGLPDDGLITSPLTTGLTYQLANYSDDNSLRLNTATPGTLTLTTPMSAISIYVLCATGSGISSMGVQVNFSDGTNQIFPAVTVNDWHGGTPYEIGQTTRIQRTAVASIPENQTSGPRMYPKQFTLSLPNQSKIITSIQITRSSGPGVLNVFAVSAEIPDVCSGTPNPGNIITTATEIDCNTSVNLALDGNTNLNGISFQWQYNISGSWLNFGSNADAVTSAPLFTDTWFRCVVTCTEDGSSATTDSVLVTVSDLEVDLGADTTVCPGTNLVLDAGYAGASYIWNNNTFNQTLSVTNPGSYYVIVTLSNGCNGRDTIVVTQGVMPINVLPPITNLCEGDMGTLNAGNGGSSFLWSTGQTTQAISTDVPGIYEVTITSPDDCVLNASTELFIRPIPEVELGNDTAVCPGVAVSLDAGTQVAGTGFAWSNGDTTQLIEATDSGWYQVVVTSPYNCVQTDELHIEHFPAPYVEGFNFIPMFYDNLGVLFFEPLNPVHYTSVEWDFGDGSPTTTEENPQHIYTSEGNYLVSLTVFNDCGAYTTTQALNVDLPTGIGSVHSPDARLDLYPNPSKSIINVVLHDSELTINGYTIYNVLGAVVQQSELPAEQQKLQLSVAELASGLYTLRVHSNKGWLVRKFQIVR